MHQLIVFDLLQSMASSNKYPFIDSLIVLLNLATGQGCVLLFLIIPQFLLQGSSLRTYLIVAFVDIIYLLLRFQHSHNYRLNGFSIFGLVFFLLLYNVVNCLRTGEEYLSPFFYVLQICLFVLILYKLYSEYHSNKADILYLLCKGFFCLAVLSVIGMIVSFIMASMGIMLESSLPAMDFLESNQAGGGEYKWLNLTMLDFAPLRVPFFQEYGMFTGLYHEPHVLTYMVFPFFMLCIAYIKNRFHSIVLLLVSLMIVLLSGSFTNIAVLLACFIIYSATHLKKSFWTIIIISVLVIIPVYYFINSNEVFFLFIESRMDEDNASQGFSLRLLEYMFYPKSLLGTNFFSTKYVEMSNSTADIGWIAFIINSFILFSFVRNIHRLFKAGNREALSVALASLYFILHSAKMGMLLYHQSLFYFLLFIQFVTIQLYGRVNVVKTTPSQRVATSA